MKKKYSYCLLIFFFSFSISVNAQILVNDSEDLTNVVERLGGKKIKIFNINYRFSPNAKKKPAGSFSDVFGYTGLDKGLLLTSGAAINALGPNYLSAISLGSLDSIQDPDLIPFIEDYDLEKNRMNDECYVEFDLISASPVVSFNYVFASEEYIEFLDFHDVFAFLISGPGINGSKNLAVIPGTTTPVSVASINPNKNSQYYISNGTGSTPYINIDIQYDGLTTVLVAQTEVIPCEIYHFKLAIADLGDDAVDSGVFIEEGSIVSRNLEIEVIYEHPRFNYAIEGCNDAMIVFKRPKFSDLSLEIKYNFLIKGDAQNNIDYSHVADSIVISPGQDSAFITISPIKDLIADDGEVVRLVLQSNCPYFSDSDSIDVVIKESFPYFIPSEKICSGQSVILNKVPNFKDSIFWDSSPYLSCEQCSSPVAHPVNTTSFPYTAKDTASGCTARDSAKVEIVSVKADFSFHHDLCYSNLDFFFVNQSQNATYYLWNFGENTSSTESDPLHQYPFFNKKDPISYDVTLVASSENPSCSSDTTITVGITDPLFIPNLITPNTDGKNDWFEITGVNTSSCWTLDIYNRWGNLVFKEEDYKNKFDGIDLPNDIYYYNLQNGLKDREFKGWLEIIN